MSEQELKLHVPKHARAGVQAALRRGAVSAVRLRAQYFDTQRSALAKAGAALRLRLEGRRWIQTLKMPGKHQLEKLEINTARPGPSLDLTVYENTPAAALIRKHATELKVVYQTDIRRVYRRIRTNGATVEVALDQGHIESGELKLPVSEVEFELISGQTQGIFDLGLKWLKAHGLILDLRSKAERGTRLAALDAQLAGLGNADDAATRAARAKAIARFWAPRGIEPVKLTTHMTCQHALSAVTAECLEQIARNAAVLAEIDTAGLYRAATAEHTHQLRVAIRRLRSAWSLFKALAQLPDSAQRDAIKVHFAALGNTRDDDVLRETVMPELSAAGQPSLQFKANQSSQVTDSVASSVQFQHWLVTLLAQNVTVQNDNSTQAQPNSAPPVALDKALGKTLQRWHQKVLADGLRFDKLAIQTQHELRKRAKRLRYGLQFAESLLPAKRLGNYRRSLSKIQDILGEMNDLYVAREKFELMRDEQPPAWFAVGWIASRLSVLTSQAQRAFKALEKTERFWG